MLEAFSEKKLRRFAPEDSKYINLKTRYSVFAI